MPRVVEEAGRRMEGELSVRHAVQLLQQLSGDHGVILTRGSVQQYIAMNGHSYAMLRCS